MWKRLLVTVSILLIVASSCKSGTRTEVMSGQAETTYHIPVKDLKIFTVDVPGEAGERYSKAIEWELRRLLEPYLHMGSRFTLHVLDMKVTPLPTRKRKEGEYVMTLSAQLSEPDGKRPWYGTIEQPLKRGTEDTLQQFEWKLVDAACESLVRKLPIAHSSGD